MQVCSAVKKLQEHQMRIDMKDILPENAIGWKYRSHGIGLFCDFVSRKRTVRTISRRDEGRAQ